MIFLKSLLFIVWNISFGLLLIYTIKWFLFNPKPRRFLGIRNPLTPGFLVRKRDWLFNKARDILHDYLDQAANPSRVNGYLHNLEEQIRDKAREQTSFVDDWYFLPHSLKEKIREGVANAVRGIASKILRKTVPHFIEQWRIECRIDEYDDQFNMEFFYKYFRKYVYVPLLKIVAAINLLIGILNMILFLILA
jgi:hypothetical protein